MARRLRVKTVLDQVVEDTLTIKHHTFKRGDKVKVRGEDNKLNFTFYALVRKPTCEYVQVRSLYTGNMHYYRQEKLVVPPKPKTRTRKTKEEAA